ncbi:uncharacterized protein [Miscanthus floridulus]|uniref:uncharacterized protein isoform X2 n=1 Tax=Miscanthus floridulus TaxID=154761 RepID=UPI00345B0EC8
MLGYLGCGSEFFLSMPLPLLLLLSAVYWLRPSLSSTWALIFLYNYTLLWENRALQIFLYSYTLTTSKYSMHRFEALAYGDFSNYDPKLFRCLIGLISVTNYICR